MSESINKICRLCLQPWDRKESHILPSFVFRWFKETSGTGFIRFSGRFKLRVQDGPVEKLLCERCEQRLGKWEKCFAEEIFTKVTRDLPAPYIYGTWLATFAASVCWKVLIFFQGRAFLKHLNAEQISLVPKALERWRRFILGIDQTVDIHDLHFIPVGLIRILRKGNGSIPPPNINRYLSRYIDMDVVKGSDQAYVFAKMGPAIILGFIQRPNQEQWLGSKIVINGGEIGNRFALPAPFEEYLFRKALRILDSQRTLSSKQRRIIAESYEKNKDRAITSGTMRAINADVEMFGVDAVFPPENRDEEI